MRYSFLFIVLSCYLLKGMVVDYHPLMRLRVDSPRDGDVLQGVIEIVGSTTANGFQSSEIAFAFQRSEPVTWFLIHHSDQPVRDGILAQWDTTTISDGDYQLRVVVNLVSGQKEEVVVKGLRVRNYTAIETNTPVPASLVVTETIAGEDISTIIVSYPTEPRNEFNPARIASNKLMISVVVGVFVVIILFVLIGLYIWFGSTGRKY